MKSWLTLLYTLTETHVGGSGSWGATDLPIARESTTDLPFIPDTALKGVVRDVAETFSPRGDRDGRIEPRDIDRLLGHGPDDPRERENRGQSRAGDLSVSQGTLLLYPLRSLQRPFVYATSALLLDRLVRLTKAFYVDLPDLVRWQTLLDDTEHVRVASGSLANVPLVVEGMAFSASDVRQDAGASALAESLEGWFGDQARKSTGKRIASDLVVLPDQDFLHLVRTATPVRARNRLNENKTTTGGGGNLWYEEMLPSDCLFWSIFSVLPRGQANGSAHKVSEDVLGLLLPSLNGIQIGAGETTGHGRCWWWSEGTASMAKQKD